MIVSVLRFLYFLQPVPPLAEAIAEVGFLKGPPKPIVCTEQFFELSLATEAMAMARVHGSDVRFARSFCEMMQTMCERSLVGGAMFYSSAAWRIVLDMARSYPRDKIVMLASAKAFFVSLTYQPDTSVTVAESGAIDVFAAAVKARVAIGDDDVDYAKKLVALLRSVGGRIC